MPQNECQQMPLQDFYSNLRNKISTLYNTLSDMERVSEFLNTMDAQTATNMGMEAQARDDIADLRVAINEVIAFYEGGSTTRTHVLKDEINKLRYI
jgi:predicted RNase H-related nuclease YkuK (DUF458 family)